MARKPRIHFPGAVYHVIPRGNAGQNVFFDDKDRCRFYLLMQEGLERYGHRVLAFCLLINHAHPAIQIGNVPLSRIMQNLSFCSPASKAGIRTKNFQFKNLDELLRRQGGFSPANEAVSLEEIESLFGDQQDILKFDNL